MRDKAVCIIILGIIFICMFGCIPQYFYNHKENSTSDEISVAWEERYPFDETEQISRIEEKLSRYVADNLLETYTNLVESVETKIENGFNSNFLLRIPIVEMNGKILKLMGIKLISGSDTVVDLGDGYLSLIEEEKDIADAANEVNEFADWLKEKGINFLYVQAPFKIESERNEVSGYTDYSNRNADCFLNALDENIDTFDLRTEMQQEFGINYKEQFFKTDHHWLPQTGLWATQKIAEVLNESYSYEIETALFDVENYEVETYEEWLLGSLGKKVTLGYTDAENLDIYYPRFETNLHVKVASLDVDVIGNFYDTLIYQRVLQKRDYYAWDSYWTYGYGDRALIQITNLSVSDNDSGQKILMIKDSFADTVYPFLALGVKEMDIIDMRHFTGSLRSYIEETNPSMVIFLCNPSSLPDGAITRSTHESIFDLR